MAEFIEGKAILKNNVHTGSIFEVTVWLSPKSVIVYGMAHDISVNVTIAHENGVKDKYFVVDSYSGKHGDVFKNGKVYNIPVAPPVKPSDKILVKAYFAYKLTNKPK